jgi:hypothetical protein
MRGDLEHYTSSKGSHLKDAGNAKIRIFLVGWTAVLTLLVFVAYLCTQDIHVLLGGTTAAIAVTFVYRYYFG